MDDISLSTGGAQEGILDVTPVNSIDEDDEELSSTMSETAAEQLCTNSTPSDDSDYSNIDSDEASGDSSSGSSSDAEIQESTGQMRGRRGSEWDKAMKKGRPSKGHAGDLFADQSTDRSTGAKSPDKRFSPSKRPPRYMETPPPPSAASVSSQSTALPPRPTSQPGGIMRPHPSDTDDLSSGVLPDVLMTMRQKIESLTLFDSDMIKLADNQVENSETRESLKRSSQQAISAAVLVSLAHKRYERRRLAAMEIEKTVRGLAQVNELARVRAILLLLSDDYVRSTSQDARKGGVVALAACAIGLKKAAEGTAVEECRDLILASVVHACQDHSVRVRYYAAESLFNVIKNIPSLAIQHFFILFEILRSLYADVDSSVRDGSALVDSQLKTIILEAMNAGVFSAEDCVPVFARFVYIHNKATNALTLSWLQELNEKLDGSPILEFLHLFLGGIFDMVSEADRVIRESALAFLQSVLPKLLTVNKQKKEKPIKVDFDKVLQSLVTTMEHPDPFVRKVAMYWMSRIVKAHMGPPEESTDESPQKKAGTYRTSHATVSVRNSLPHVLPGVLLSIGDEFNSLQTTKDSFLPDQSTRLLAEQTNACLQDAVRREGSVYVQHLDGFIVALREELDSPGGVSNRNPPAVSRKTFRVDVREDGSGIESPGWFRVNDKVRSDEGTILSRLCALHWVIVLYESVVPHLLKSDYAREFVFAIIHQLAVMPPKSIIFKSLEVLAKITVSAIGEKPSLNTNSGSLSTLGLIDDVAPFPMTNASVAYALDVLESQRRSKMSRDREVFASLIQLHARNERLLGDLTSVITYMCRLQPPEFVVISFAVEIERFVRFRELHADNQERSLSSDLKFVSSFVQHLSHVLLTAEETRPLRDVLKDCIGRKGNVEKDQQRSRLFHVVLHSFSHNLAATLSLCFWTGAYRTAWLFLRRIDTLDINLILFLEIDRLIEMLERPLFRHLHIRMLEHDKDSMAEGSGAMLFSALKCLLMIIPQSTCYHVLKDRLVSASRYRQSTAICTNRYSKRVSGETELYVNRVLDVRRMHCAAAWQSIRAESLEVVQTPQESKEDEHHDEGSDRRQWLGYASKDQEAASRQAFADEKRRFTKCSVEEVREGYHDFDGMVKSGAKNFAPNKPAETRTPKSSAKEEEDWKQFWDVE